MIKAVTLHAVSIRVGWWNESGIVIFSDVPEEVLLSLNSSIAAGQYVVIHRPLAFL
jgi:hydrogenase maturation factor